ncbi:MAG: type II secretion system F family protein [DPANN group archaeon]|nr:type II secretion system F family protein [DPANN group archaeon]
MKLSDRVYFTVQKFLPRFYVEIISRKIRYANIKIQKEVWAGFTFMVSLFISILITVVMASQTQSQGLLIAFFLGVFFAVSYTIYVIVQLMSDQRTQQIENVLPDALRLISANIKVGITPDKALFLSARPEFGVFSDEILRVAEETIAGKTIMQAMVRMTDRTESVLLKRVVELINEGLNSGGELASLLEKTADDIRVSSVLNQEIQSNIGSYVIFMMLAVLIAAPMLYATSMNFIVLTDSIKQSIGLEALSQAAVTGVNIPFIGSSKQISIDFGALRLFSVINISISAFFASMLLGIFRDGQERTGLPYVPVFIIGGLLVYFIADALIGGLMAGFFS